MRFLPSLLRIEKDFWVKRFFKEREQGLSMPSISLCMIVKKVDYPFLPTCLKNVQKEVDEIVMVVDEIDQEITKISGQFHAKLVEHPFRDFAGQRNVSLQRATKDWVLILDADEILASDDVKSLKKKAENNHAVACTLNQLNYTNDTNQMRFVPAKNEITQRFGFQGYFVVPAIRFFKNHMGFRFSRKVHEMVDETIEKKGLGDRVVKTDIPIHHLKMLKPSVREDELRYLSLLEEEVKENPKNFKALFDMGTINLFILKDVKRAVHHFKKALEINPAFTEVKLNLAFAYGQLKEYEQALTLYQGVTGKEKNFSLLSNIGTCLFFLGRYEEAVRMYQEAAVLDPERKKEAGSKIALVRKAMG